MGTLRVASFNEKSYVDGPGARAVVYLQGCLIRCEGCQSPHLWDLDGGEEWDVVDVAGKLLDTELPVTISGGEPFAQAEGVAELLVALRIQRPEIEVIVYSGYVFEDLLEMAQAIPAISWVLENTNVLVDGPFSVQENDDFVQWRGSRNQRVIDVQATLRTAGFTMGRLVLLDWDTQVLTVTAEGDVVGTGGQMEDLFDADALEETKMCGEVKHG
jgi:anaerobic ribonucleoside-triphosphate reductase activating protein